MNDTAVRENMEQQVAACRHHWVIAAPAGATSMGRCKVCGQAREFRNSAGDGLWDRDRSEAGDASWNGSLRRDSILAPTDEGY